VITYLQNQEEKFEILFLTLYENKQLNFIKPSDKVLEEISNKINNEFYKHQSVIKEKEFEKFFNKLTDGAKKHSTEKAMLLMPFILSTIKPNIPPKVTHDLLLFITIIIRYTLASESKDQVMVNFKQFMDKI